jgi:hypothetical protein
MRRCIGLDVHRDFAQVAIWEGGVVRDAGRVATSPEGLRAFDPSVLHHFLKSLHRTVRSSICALRSRVRSRKRRIAGGGTKPGRTSPCSTI